MPEDIMFTRMLDKFAEKKDTNFLVIESSSDDLNLKFKRFNPENGSEIEPENYDVSKIQINNFIEKINNYKLIAEELLTKFEA